MSRVRFRQSVVRQMPLIEERGYRLEDAGASDIVRFNKLLVPGVSCRIEFQPARFISPVGRFKVDLFRLRLPDFDKESNHYAPLVSPLMGLLQLYYTLDIFPPDKVTWGFTNQQEFYEELNTIRDLLLVYGIKWLEDPASNMDWAIRKA